MSAVVFFNEELVLLNKFGKAFAFVLWGIFLYYLTISAFGWIRRKEISAKSFEPKNKFAILVAAHNEETVIASIIKSLKQIEYPKDMYDIYVVADNCTDDTAEISRLNDVFVYERFNEIKKGKGYSMEWMFKKLFNMEKQYDAVCVLDADNLVSPNFLLEMNKHMCMGHEVVQGYLDSKNPSDSWISGNNSIAFWISNRLIQLPRYYLGLSCILGGTGFIISTKVLKELGWGATCLAEDLEFSLKLALKGKKVFWAHDAVIYDEKPLTIAQSWRQRKRWMQGHFDCSRRFLGPLLRKAIKERNAIALDLSLYLMQPIIVVVNGIGVLTGPIYLIFVLLDKKPFSMTDFLVIFLSFASMYISIIFVLIEGKLKSLKILKYLLLMPIYNLTWVPIIIQGFIDKDKKEWFHTAHTRNMDISDLEIKFSKR